MKSSIISSEELVSSSRWDAPYFIGSGHVFSAKYPLVSISDLVEERKKFIEPQSYPEHMFNYIGLENISQNTRTLVDFNPKRGVEIKSRTKVFRKGDLLYSRLRPYLNKVLLIDDELNEGICSTEIFVLSPKIKIINPVYLSELLTSSWSCNEIDRLSGGATLPRINITDFLNIKIPVPPINVQLKLEQFINKNRAIWKDHAHNAEKIPVSIKDAIDHFLTEGGDLNLNVNNSALETRWNNPLPDIELK